MDAYARMGNNVRQPVNAGTGITTEYAVGGLVLGCLIALILIRRGFRGINIPGVGSAGLR